MEKYNKKFSIKELSAALRKSHDTAPGPDKIHYQFIKQLPPSCLIILRDIFNKVWVSGKFPSIWREATVIPIPKPQKNATIPTNYRPIALTSCICKTMERMINDRLVWYIESNKLLTIYQSGFRKHRSTIDHLIKLESFIRESFVRGEHNVAIFFDLEKAYDTTWKYGIMKDLFDLGLRGHLPGFIQNFLNDRTFQVRLGTTLSDPFEQDCDPISSPSPSFPMIINKFVIPDI